jgi:serine-type D-Ala-D-Ala carboxypeptidase/endopeptidase (penicillin-binding protein 4)
LLELPGHVQSPVPFHRAPGRALAAALLAAALLLPATPPNVAAQAPAATRPATDTRLAARIDALLDRAPLAAVQWGVEVRDVETGHVLYRRNADLPMAPASNLKLVIAAAAAHHLPGDWRFRTSLLADGEVRDGTLHGDLVLYGRGDPNFSARYFDTRTAVLEGLADSLRARGIHRIAGAVIADESAWDVDYVHADWNEESRRWWYGAPVGALGFNDNSIDLRVEPGPAVGRPARITPMPSSGFYTLENRTTTVAAGQAHTATFNRIAGTNRIVATGQVPRGAGVVVRSFAVVDPAGYTGTVFREALERAGIAVADPRVRVVSTRGASASERAHTLVEYRSPELPQVIDPILRNSQNWYAEQLAKALGRELRGEGSWDAGLGVAGDFLAEVVGIPRRDFVLRDASGLSARNRITPAALTRLLAYIHHAPEQAMVRESLPEGGRTGSLRNRMAELGPRVRAKTGYIREVNGLSGFVTTESGREVAFAVLANGGGQPPARVRAAIDEVVRAIASEAR